MRTPRFGATWLALLGIGSLGGCTSPAEREAEPIGQARSAVVGGTASDAAQDAVVMLVFSNPAANQRGICTAVLLAPRLVLTARHCVAFTDADVACGTDGAALGGGAIRANHEPGQLYVFTGRSRPDLDPTMWKPSGRGLEIIDDGSKNLCNHDLALVVLENPVEGAMIAPIRLDGDAAKGEGLTTVGWGVTSDVLEPTSRQQRAGVTVTRIGPDPMSPILTPNEFSFDESICLGDSGGPILSTASGAVVGVVSRGGNGTSSETDLASTCTKATNLGTKIAPFRELVTRGLSRAGAEARLEVRPPAKDEEEGCRAAGGSGRRSAPVAVLFGVLGIALVRRRKT
jgi:hypothetical protein